MHGLAGGGPIRLPGLSWCRSSHGKDGERFAGIRAAIDILLSSADTHAVGALAKRMDPGDGSQRLRNDQERGLTMAKELRCGDLMPGCNAVIEGKDEAEVMAKGVEHAKTAHKMTTIPPDMAAKVKAAIKDKK
jgi:predicted small metal-binding protein